MEIMNMKLKMMATLWDNTYRVAMTMDKVNILVPHV